MKPASLLSTTVGTIAIALAMVFPTHLASQGVTTATLTGIVSSDAGAALSVANIVAVHLPSGTQYRASVTSSGRYSIPNMRVGGPYRVTATSLGYEPRSESDVNL